MFMDAGSDERYPPVEHFVSRRRTNGSPGDEKVRSLDRKEL